MGSAFQEIWGDKIRRARRLSWKEIEPMTVWQIHVSPRLRTVELQGETLAVIKATVQCFVGRYALSQEWGRALMAHPDEIDGLQYIGRRCGRTCLALFGDDAAPKEHQVATIPKPLGPLKTWRGLWPFLDRIQVALHELPATRPPSDWI